jgi:hypothetical protein
MRAPHVAVLALAIETLTVMGCSGTPSTPAPNDVPAVAARSAAVPTTERGLLFVVDSSYSGVFVYRQNSRNKDPFRQITQDLLYSNAVWVDTRNNVWVANGGSVASGNKATIVRFPHRGTGAPDRILDDFGQIPIALWVSGVGSLYVVNYPTSASQPAEIIEYAPHAKTYKVIGDRNISHDITAVVGDANGDLFASGFTSSGVGEIDERPAGSKHWDDTGIAGDGRAVNQPLDLAFDADGNLVVDDYGNAQIDTFPPGKTKPSNTIQCLPADCRVIAFSRSGTRLWVGEPNYSTGAVYEFEYPSGKFIKRLMQPEESSPASLATSPSLYAP